MNPNPNIKSLTQIDPILRESPQWEFCWIPDGESFARTGDQRYAIRPGDFLMCPPDALTSSKPPPI